MVMIDEVEQPDQDILDGLLRQGLRGMPVPMVSADFDERVLDAVRPRRPWWWIDWAREGAPLLVQTTAGALACILTVGVTLLLGGVRTIRFSPGQVAQSTVAAVLQAADTGQVSAATLLLRHSAPPPPVKQSPASL